MAAAGIVTSDSSVFEEMVAADPAEIRELALASRALIFDVLPRTVEVVWPRQRTAGYGTGPKKPREPGPASTGHSGDNTSGTADCLTGARHQTVNATQACSSRSSRSLARAPLADNVHSVSPITNDRRIVGSAKWKSNSAP